MPTNLLRSRSSTGIARTPRVAEAGFPRSVLITAGRVTIRAEVLDTPTGRRLLAALPLYSTAETWGDCVHFEVPVETGRERGARINVTPGDIGFWSEHDRVIIAFGPTPISKRREIRLPSPCNMWARSVDDVSLLKAVRPGEKVSVTVAADQAATS
ncbi:MAG: hypothetical protein CTY20_13435 [Hyphomicrobium sp.]|nr:MAG: hypothetical protein CTY20_13435 [Hyphomicrobium sp.]